jgi:probable AcnD-accessory protein PrpF
MATKQTSIRATYMRGGTSKGVFFDLKDLPEGAQKPGALRDQIMLRVIGSPDPYGQHIDGMGGATSSTSKVVIIGKSSQPDCDVDYLFGAVSIDKPVVDWSGNCGNLTSAVGPFAIDRGLVKIPENGMAVVRIWQANINKKIIAHVPVKDGQVVELGDFELDGVTFPAAEIKLEFLEPGADEDGEGGSIFPTGNLIDTLNIPGVGEIKATLINAGIPSIFIDAKSIGLTGVEMQKDVNTNPELLKKFETIRSHATVAMGLATSAEEVTAKRPHSPKIAFFSKPQTYIASSGKTVDSANYDVAARIVSMGKLHHAMTGTGAVAIAVAGSIKGTVVAEMLEGGSKGEVCFGHPSGSLKVGAEAAQVDGEWTVTKAVMSRSARRLMEGQILVPIK